MSTDDRETLADKLVAEADRRRRAAFQRVVVLVVGDVMVDRWLHGGLWDCQDDCRKFVVHSEVVRPGGAGNAAESLAGWGASVDVRLYGQPAFYRPTKTRLVDSSSGKILQRVDDERALRSMSWPPNYKQEHDDALEMVPFAGAVLLADYDKGFLTPKFIREAVETCADHGVPCVVDAKRPPALYGQAILKCNGDYQHRHNDALAARCEGADRVVVTYGYMNPIIWDDGPHGLGYDLPRVKCVNHVGAGDCFAAHLALGLACGFSLKNAAAVAHSAGRVYVRHPHNRPPQPSEICEDARSAARGFGDTSYGGKIHRQ